jgi:transcription elongation factor S-II
LDGTISTSSLVVMNVKDMASDDVKSSREKAIEWHTEAATLKNHSGTVTSMFKCGKCGSRETSYYQMQTRGYLIFPTFFAHNCKVLMNR